MRHKKEIFVIKESGKKKIKIENNGYGIDILVMKNGYQWSGVMVDDELLEMLRDSINQYFTKKHIGID